MKKRCAVMAVGMMAMVLAGCKAEETEKVYKIATDTTFAPFEFENDKE